ncbi:hypothetical protein U0070_009390 [Myodes glareolus]|uniref:Small ribosomal subunit protein uS17 N-terminal domain-containing protein n=1 Tax=Myodes glareolus TaxID=447135 RepID=A0AAW0HVA8_MYOGA
MNDAKKQCLLDPPGQMYIGNHRETSKEKLPQYYKNTGLGFKTLKIVIKGTSIGKKCPFIGNISIQDWLLFDVMIKMKMQRTIVIC